MYPEDLLVPVVRLHYDRGHAKSTVRSNGPFIRGPIPIDWIAAASGLPGKTLNTALALWWLSGMKNHNEVKMSKQALAYFDVSDDAYRDALSRLEKARLVTVRRQPGQRAWVKINHAAQAASQGIDLQAGQSAQARCLGLPPPTGWRPDDGSDA
jgi:hypothetical protein